MSIGDRYEDVPADIAYRNLVEGEDAFERACEEQLERTALMYEQQPEPDYTCDMGTCLEAETPGACASCRHHIPSPEPDADDVIDAAVLAVELAHAAEAEEATR